MVPARWKIGAALCVALVVAVSARASTPSLAQIEARVGRLEALLGQAHFREAAVAAPAVRSLVLALPPSAATRQLLVRAEVVAGTAALALRQQGTAQVCFLRALQLEPALKLPPSTPPKVQRTLDSVREAP